MSKDRYMILDRDGIINYDFGYVGSVERLELINDNLEIISYLSKHFHPIIITNQSGIARKFFTEKQHIELTKYLNNILSRDYQIKIIHTYYCPHHPDHQLNKNTTHCNCRKPKIGLFERAIRDFKIDVTKSISIGDKKRDIEPSIKLGFMENFLLSSEIKMLPEDKSFNQISDLKEILSYQSIQNIISEN